MVLLLDTHALLWWANEPEKLSRAAYEAVRDEQNAVLISVVSLWETQIKAGRPGLTMDLPLPEFVRDHVVVNGFRILPFTPDHGFALGGLPMIHRDPFDRLLVAQALVEGAALVTVDGEIAKYAIPTLW